MSLLVLILNLLFSQVFAEDSVLMVSPRNGERIEISEYMLRLSWVSRPNINEYYLDIFLKPDKSTKKIEVRGNSFELRLKKIPPVLYWRVRAKGDPKPSRKLYIIYLYGKHSLNVRVNAQQLTSRISLRSKNANGAATVQGSMLDAFLDYSPVSWKNKYSIAVNMRASELKNGSDSLEEQRIGGEFGYHFKSHLQGKNILYLGYHLLNKLSFQFDNSIKAGYNVNFLTMRYFYQRPILQTWELEIGTGVQLSIPSTFRPSLIFKPLLGKRLGMNWRLDGFLLYENYVSHPKGTNGENTVVRLQNIGAGIGMVYRH